MSWGPAGDLDWMGFNWVKRSSVNTDRGFVNFNDPNFLVGGVNPWAPGNITGPDGNGYLTFHFTGASNTAAELITTQNGFGYGTYVVVLATALNSVPLNQVWGGMYLYDWGQLSPGGGPPYSGQVSNWNYGENADTKISNNEMDICECSDFGGGTDNVGHNLWYNNAGTKTQINDLYVATADVVTTHQLIWLPTSVVFTSYIGTGTGGTVIHSTTQTTHLPVPAGEGIHINIWNYATATPSDFSVIVRSVTFTPMLFGSRRVGMDQAVMRAGFGN